MLQMLSRGPDVASGAPIQAGWSTLLVSPSLEEPGGSGPFGVVLQLH